MNFTFKKHFTLNYTRVYTNRYIPDQYEAYKTCHCYARACHTVFAEHILRSRLLSSSTTSSYTLSSCSPSTFFFLLLFFFFTIIVLLLVLCYITEEKALQTSATWGRNVGFNEETRKTDLGERDENAIRWMCGVTRKDNIRNEHIRGTTRVKQASKKITEKRLNWHGHI